MYAEIIVDIAHENVDRLYTYKLDIPAQVGQRALVPFGKGDRPTEGYILGIKECCDMDESKLKAVIRTLEDYSVLDEKQIQLSDWICKTYHCTRAQSLRLFIPAQLRGMRIAEKKLRCVRIKDTQTARMYMQSLVSKAGKVRSKAAYDTIELLLQAPSSIAVTDLYKIVDGCNSTIIKRLTDADVLEQIYNTEYRRPTVFRGENKGAPLLTCEQENALTQIRGGMSSSGGTYLVHGVTGSGKTEVYMRVIADALEKGRGAIVLVPEISLTPQTVSRFTDRFGDGVAIIHSRLSAGERFDEWRRIRKGKAHVVVGARSAVFAPVNNLGVIIIDEEHENTYSSETVPRYNTLEVANKRALLCGGVLVLGSATPSVTTYFRAKTGKYRLIELSKRVNNMPLPDVQVVDMRSEFLSGNNGIFSDALKDKLHACIKSGEQAILFLNRRGYSSFVSCRACGHLFKCDMCDVSMTYHKSEHKMKCHYCGDVKDVPKICPVCGKPYIKYSGIGTQQIEEELLRLFPNVSCIRMDADTTRGKDAHMRLLSEFASGRAQVLIGTQMIAKGLDFPNVTLVGIVSVDSMLAMPDFRNTERTFQLLTQVAGRAGRADKAGSVVLQTSDPEHSVIAYACAHDYKSFYAYAIQNRQLNLYPPFSVFVRILFLSEEDEPAYNASVEFSRIVYKKMCDILKARDANLAEIAFIYAMPAPIRRIQGRYRHHVLMKLARTRNTRVLLDCIYLCADEYSSDILSSVEVNPNDML